jgi:putative DNA modification/repair radical SAM protein
MNELITEKLRLLTEGAKYDVSCSSSGSSRKGQKGLIGDTKAPGICHSWAADGRCVSLLKVLYSNACIYDCAYCVNRASADFKRVSFEPKELVDITMNFYKRNYIEGLFISSAVFKSPDHTMERMIEVIKILRNVEGYNGYIHLKGIPGADQKQLDEAGKYADRISINLELPTEKSLRLLAPEKKQETMFLPMNYLKQKHQENKQDLKKYSFAKPFMPAGQTTQMMIGASPDSDYSILRLSEAMYGNMAMKRVYYSAYVPVVKNNPLLPSRVHSPLLREHRLYQADWLLRFYGFKAGDILNEKNDQLDLEMDPKCNWALKHMNLFPIEINKASFEWLIRIPGIGHTSAQKICQARRFGALSYENLKKMGVVLKRAKYFILIKGKYYGEVQQEAQLIRNQIIRIDPKAKNINLNQITLDQYYPEIFGANR